MFVKASNSETKINILIHKHLGKIFLVYCDFLIPQKSICTRKMHIHNYIYKRCVMLWFSFNRSLV